MSYPVLADVKSYLKVSSASEDAILTTMLNAAIGDVEAHCNRVFVAASATRNYPVIAPYFDARRRLMTLYEDLVSITTLTNGTGEVIAASDYEVLPVKGGRIEQIMIKREAPVRFQTGSSGETVQLSGSWGYAATCPSGVFLLLIELVEWHYRLKQGASAKADSTVRRGGGISGGTNIPEYLRHRLEVYRRYS